MRIWHNDRFLCVYSTRPSQEYDHNSDSLLTIVLINDILLGKRDNFIRKGLGVGRLNKEVRYGGIPQGRRGPATVSGSESAKESETYLEDSGICHWGKPWEGAEEQ